MLLTIKFLGTFLIAGGLAHSAASSAIGQDAPRNTPQSAPQNIPQNPPSNIAQERAAILRQQLAELEEQQKELQTRLSKLEEDSKPENIEKSLAGVGSTRPEDLREQRRRQFEIQRTNLEFQLDRLARSKTRLETGIAQADADAYRLSAGGNKPQQPSTISTNATQQGTADQAQTNSTVRRRPRRPRKSIRRPRRISGLVPAAVPTQAEAHA